jgi:hypothetical protein
LTVQSALGLEKHSSAALTRIFRSSSGEEHLFRDLNEMLRGPVPRVMRMLIAGDTPA